MEWDWGHQRADWDAMWLLGGRWGVYVSGGNASRENACLEFHPDGCPPAYCRLEVTDIDRLLEAIRARVDSWWKTSIQARLCIQRSGGRCWLDTYRTVRQIVANDDVTISGPAGQEGLNEYIMTLVCSDPPPSPPPPSPIPIPHPHPHPDMEREFRSRNRGQWPPQYLLDIISQLPMLMVPIGHKYSPDYKRQARLSWSHCELLLMQEVPERVRQGYILPLNVYLNAFWQFTEAKLKHVIVEVVWAATTWRQYSYVI